MERGTDSIKEKATSPIGIPVRPRRRAPWKGRGKKSVMTADVNWYYM